MSRRPRQKARSGGEEGSVLLLTICYVALSIALVIVAVDATSLYLEQRRLDSVADSAALAGADGFTITIVDGEAVATLDDEGVREQAVEIVAAFPNVALAGATAPDDRSARVTVTTVWHPPITSLLIPGGVPLESTSTSRNALR